MPERFDVFLSYNSRDQAAVERIAEQLKRARLEPWLDKWSLTPGGEWQRELGAGLDASVACAVFVGPHDLGAWELQEVAVAVDRAATQQGFRVFPVLLPGVDEQFEPNRLPHFLRSRTWVDFRRGINDGRALQDLVHAIKGVPFGPDVPVVAMDDVAPYRGLRVFAEEDARFFFGRDREIQRLVEKLKRSTFLAVLGPSGSGKSSLVRAGLVPTLRAGALSDVDDWRVCVLRPGAAPLTALAAQLVTLRPHAAMAATLDELAGDARALHLGVELALADGGARDRVLVIVDQLEEIFTLCRDEAERRQLFSLLLYAAAAPGTRTVVIVTMRADFYARCAGYPELAQLIAAEQLLVGPMDPDALRQVIEEPARRVGLELEHGLAQTILADVGQEPGALPLLEHALLELWERRRASMLTLEGYRDAGGVHGALAQRADAIFGELTPAQQQIARRALLRLTQPGEGTEDTRRRALRSELVPAGAEQAFEEVLARLVDARMLTTGRDETGQEVVDVSHEALIRGWPRLRGWVDADRQGLVVHRRLTDAAHEWEALGREPAALYRGARLAAAREWATEHDDDLNTVEREFLATSEAAERSELAEAKRRTRRLRALATGLAALTLIAALLTVWALALLNRADERATALATLLAGDALGELDNDPSQGLVLAMRAFTAKQTDLSEGALRLATAQTPPQLILRGHTGAVHGVAFAPDGRHVASASEDGTVWVWDWRAPRSAPAILRGHTRAVHGVAFARDGRSTILRGHTDAVNGVAFARDGRHVASAGGDGTVRVWDWRAPRSAPTVLSGHTDAVNGVAFARDGRHVASAGGDGTVRVWDWRAPRTAPTILRGHTRAVNGVAFAPDGRHVASAGGVDRTVRVWDWRTPRSAPTVLRGHTDAVYGVAFARDGRHVASAGVDGTVRVWDWRTPRTAPTILHGEAVSVWDWRAVRDARTLLRGNADAVLGVAFARDGRHVASAGVDGTVRVWDWRAPRSAPTVLRGNAHAVNGVAFAPDGRHVASAGGEDRTVRVWDWRAPRTAPTILSGHTRAVNGVAFAPDGRHVASAGGEDRTVRVWDWRAPRSAPTVLSGHTRAVNGVAFARDGRHVASAGGDGTVRVWDWRAPRSAPTILRGHTRAVNGVAFARDGRHVASAGGEDRTVRVWDWRAPRTAPTILSGHTRAVNGVAFAPDGRHVASAGGEDRTVRVWDWRAPRSAPTVLSGHTRAVNGVAFAPDGRHVASAGGEDRTVRVWDWRAPRSAPTILRGHTRAVNGVAFARDGRHVASAGGDGTVRVWDWRAPRTAPTILSGHTNWNGDVVIVFSSRHTHWINGVAFAPNSRHLASAGGDRTVRVWDCQRCGDIKHVLELARARMPHTIDARAPHRTR